MAPRGGAPATIAPDSFRRTFSNVRASVAGFTRNDSEDYVQEAYARALKHHVGGSLEPWLKTVSRRIAIDHSRRQRELASGGTHDVERLLPPSGHRPEDVVISRENLGLI